MLELRTYLRSKLQLAGTCDPNDLVITGTDLTELVHVDEVQKLGNLAKSLLTETLHGPIPTKTTMTLAEGIVNLLKELGND
jgi:hypothetical protein